MLLSMKQAVPYFGPGDRGSKDAIEMSSLMHWRPLGPKTHGD